ncbi:hypothetical protein JRC04_03070 [Mycolicibacterium sp. S2-37]|uniref:hypothetical protein n=1 Tax=Mycolicibacterium sp. S2-37 TaxID=2810297 RepID=UPI001A93BD53|nr:hypothetical protein [Mycolicibacterium sp. S2-37]MBO0676441.1 hypothetical protein [Mycolicibacterium sp. S2-37]
MVAAWATVWRGGPAVRTLLLAVGIGVFLGALALLDSGMPLAAILVAVITGAVLGPLTESRLRHYWPGAAAFTGAERVQIVRAARRGYPVDGDRLARGVIDYSTGLRAAADRENTYRWVIWLVLAVALAIAVYDAASGSVRDTVASCVYLGLLAIELFWWPSRRRELLLNSALATALAGVGRAPGGNTA